MLVHHGISKSWLERQTSARVSLSTKERIFTMPSGEKFACERSYAHAGNSCWSFGMLYVFGFSRCVYNFSCGLATIKPAFVGKFRFSVLDIWFSFCFSDYFVYSMESQIVGKAKKLFVIFNLINMQSIFFKLTQTVHIDVTIYTKQRNICNRSWHLRTFVSTFDSRKQIWQTFPSGRFRFPLHVVPLALAWLLRNNEIIDCSRLTAHGWRCFEKSRT